jgi:hypothetical protein
VGEDPRISAVEIARRKLRGHERICVCETDRKGKEGGELGRRRRRGGRGKKRGEGGVVGAGVSEGRLCEILAEQGWGPSAGISLRVSMFASRRSNHSQSPRKESLSCGLSSREEETRW